MFGISKAAYYKRLKARQIKEMQHEVVLHEVAEIRKEMPRTGTRKLYEHLQPILPKHDIKMGRDGLFDILRNKGLLIRSFEK